MRDSEIIRRLRLPAPEEPALLPALVLPIDEGSDRLGAPRIRARFLEGRGRSWTSSPRLVLAVLALIVAAAATIVGAAMRLNLIPNPFDPDAGLRARGISIDIPEGWVRLTTPDPLGSSPAFTMLLVSNLGVEGCSEDDLPAPTPTPSPVLLDDGTYYVDGDASKGDFAGRADEVFACVLEQEMAPGEIRIVVSNGYPQRAQLGPIESFDPTVWFGTDPLAERTFYVPTEADGWTMTIDGMPAKLVVAAGDGARGSDETRTWAIVGPFDLGFPGLYVRAHLRGPDLEGLRDQADAIARSIRFDQKRPALDEALRDDALALAIDDFDRQERRWGGSELYGCFPRTPGSAPGSVNDRLFEYGPNGPLLEPVPVTCTTSVEETPFGLWRATLVVSWAAGDGYPAGEWGWEVFFDASGAGGQAGTLVDNPANFVPPGSVGTPPPVLTGPLVISLGSVVRVLPPGVTWETGTVRALDKDPNETIGDGQFDLKPGRLVHVVDGPLVHAGTDWYLVDLARGSSSPNAELAWIPATDAGRPLIEVMEPRCPGSEPAIVDLTRMIPAEWLLCFGSRELVLQPTTLTRVDPSDVYVGGTPEWLAADPAWRLFGSSGPDGVEPALAVAIDASMGDNVPMGEWLMVRGHFDDGASTSCRRSVDAGRFDETPAVQVLRCRERFVITSFEVVGAP